ncbi:hypothetical protein HQ545_06795 [Candidatus Woesearchaeota archaeon]|nr:hypothetical protein [Candidatus Woesearchaeota archaeon]
MVINESSIRRRSAINEYFLDAARLLRYLIGKDEKLDTIIICNPYRQKFVTTDQEVYHSLGSVKEYDDFKLNKLAKFFEVVTIRTVAKKQILTEEIVEKLRAEALRKTQ